MNVDRIVLFGSDEDSVTPQSILLDAVGGFEKKQQRRHELWILSCFINFDYVKKFINKLRKEIRLTDVYLAFNYGEIFRDGPVETNDILNKIYVWCKKFNINFEWVAVSSSSLIHAKGYSIIQRKSDKETNGVVLITSGNFTKNGFRGKNIEIGYMSAMKKDLIRFQQIYEKVWEDYEKSIDSEIEEENELLLRYSLLSSGVFLHKWSGSLKQMIGIRYSLTDAAKNHDNTPDELIALGIEPDDTFTLPLLDIKELPPKEIPPRFTRDYTIETFWGRWCPNTVWDEVKKTIIGSGEFIKSFQDATEDKRIESAVIFARKTQERLMEKDLIKKVSQDHVSNWRDKVTSLRDNTDRLERLFTGYVENSMPYDYTMTHDINELFDNAIETIELASRNNLVMKKLVNSYSSTKIGALELNDSERDELIAMLKKNKNKPRK